ncbi:MAG: 2OG-Fe(II) oxygenase [Bdellovibrio sp.]
MAQNQINLMALEKLFDDLALHNWASCDDIFHKSFSLALADECQTLHEQGAFNKAFIGYGQTKTVHSEIRGDYTYWLEESTSSALQRTLLVQLQTVMQNLNKNFYLNLKRFETHFAVYPAGSGYDKHVDNHRGSGARKITFLLYLNENWQKGHGGELSIFQPDQENVLMTQIEPKLGTFVLFRSDLFPHQVEKSLHKRMSITGWLRDDLL